MLDITVRRLREGSRFFTITVGTHACGCVEEREDGGYCVVGGRKTYRVFGEAVRHAVMRHVQSLIKEAATLSESATSAPLIHVEP